LNTIKEEEEEEGGGGGGGGGNNWDVVRGTTFSTYGRRYTRFGSFPGSATKSYQDAVSLSF